MVHLNRAGPGTCHEGLLGGRIDAVPAAAGRCDAYNMVTPAQIILHVPGPLRPAGAFAATRS